LQKRNLEAWQDLHNNIYSILQESRKSNRRTCGGWSMRQLRINVIHM
jgi:hypothetical protein